MAQSGPRMVLSTGRFAQDSAVRQTKKYEAGRRSDALSFQQPRLEKQPGELGPGSETPLCVGSSGSRVCVLSVVEI